MGRFVPHKNIPILLDVFKLLRATGLDLSLHIIGDGPLRPYVERLARDVAGASVLGPLSKEELITELKNAWVAAIPSTREGQGIAFLESMAAGTPLVTVDGRFTAVREVVQNGRNGFVTELSSEAIASAIRQLLEDQNLWKRFSEEGYRTASCYSWDESAERYEQLLLDS